MRPGYDESAHVIPSPWHILSVGHDTTALFCIHAAVISLLDYCSSPLPGLPHVLWLFLVLFLISHVLCTFQGIPLGPAMYTRPYGRGWLRGPLWPLGLQFVAHLTCSLRGCHTGLPLPACTCCLTPLQIPQTSPSPYFSPN